MEKQEVKIRYGAPHTRLTIPVEGELRMKMRDADMPIEDLLVAYAKDLAERVRPLNATMRCTVMTVHGRPRVMHMSVVGNKIDKEKLVKIGAFGPMHIAAGETPAAVEKTGVALCIARNIAIFIGVMSACVVSATALAGKDVYKINEMPLLAQLAAVLLTGVITGMLSVKPDKK